MNKTENVNELKLEAAKLREQNKYNPKIYDILNEVAGLSDVPLILEIRATEIFGSYSDFTKMIICKSTAEVTPFELLPEDGKTSDALAEKFLKSADDYIGSYGHQRENHIVPDRPSCEELEGAFSRVFSKEKYKDFPEFLEIFNEPGLKGLEDIIPYIVMVHPEKTSDGYVGKILMDTRYSAMNQKHPSNKLEICRYRMTNDL